METGLSVPTVTTILNEYQHLGILRAVGQQHTKGGRPAQLVELDAHALSILAIDLSGTEATAASTDLCGHTGEAKLGPEVRPEQRDAVLDWIRGLLQEHSKDYSKVGIAVPGVVHSERGTVQAFPSLGEESLNLVAELGATSRAEILLENDVNALTVFALSSLQHDAENSVPNNVLYVRIGERGVGAGLVLGGILFRGSHEGAGEIGLGLVDATLPSEPLALGQPGPLEHHLASLARAAREALADEKKTSRPSQAFLALAREVHRAIHNLTCAIDPELVIIDWHQGPSEELANYVRERWLGPFNVDIQAARQSARPVLAGITLKAMDKLDQELAILDGFMMPDNSYSEHPSVRLEPARNSANSPASGKE